MWFPRWICRHKKNEYYAKSTLSPVHGASEDCSQTARFKKLRETVIIRHACPVVSHLRPASAKMCAFSTALYDKRTIFCWKIAYSHVGYLYVFEPNHGKTNKVPCMPSGDSNRPSHLPYM